jgi:hypothetical protein
MANFVIVGGKAKKIKGRFGGESGGRGCDCSYTHRRTRVNAKLHLAAAFEDLYFSEPTRSFAPESKPDTEFHTRRDRRNFARDNASCADTDRGYDRVVARARTVLTHPRAVYHNERKFVAYPDGMRIVSASY